MADNDIDTAFQKMKLSENTPQKHTDSHANKHEPLQGENNFPKGIHPLSSSTGTTTQLSWRANAFSNRGNIDNRHDESLTTKWEKIEAKKQEPRMAITEPAEAPLTTQPPAKWSTSKNWRTRDPSLEKAHEEEARTIIRNESQHQGRVMPASGPRTRGGVPYADQVEGAVVWHWDIRPCSELTVAQDGQSIVRDTAGRRALKKGRYWIIVKKEGEAITEAAIYTNEDTGLAYIPSEQWADYYSICPKHIDASKFKNLSPTNDVLKIGRMREVGDKVEGMLTRETMVVHWKQTHQRNIDIDDLRIVGWLCEKSRKIICEKVATLYRFL